VKRPVLLALAAILVVVVNRLLFLADAERTVGHVTGVWGQDGRCGRRRSKYDCTRFDARVEYVVAGTPLTIDIDAGRARGHGQPVSRASFRTGAAVTVVHAPGGRPAYQDTFFAIWGGPLFTFVFGIASAFGGLRKEER
jgi:hypothetical protein